MFLDLVLHLEGKIITAVMAFLHARECEQDVFHLSASKYSVSYGYSGWWFTKATVGVEINTSSSSVKDFSLCDC